MPTVNVQPAASTDDISWSTATTSTIFSTNATIIRIGDATSTDFDRCALLRFVPNIPQGSTISAAKIILTPSGVNGAIPNMRIDGVLSGNFVMPTTRSAANLLSRTTANVAYPAPGTWVTGTPQDTPSLVSVLQELVNQPTYASGNAIGIAIRDDQLGQVTGQINFYAFDHATLSANRAELEVTYTSGSAVPNAGPDQGLVASLATVNLTSAGSTGSPTAYLWRVISGGGTLSSTTAANPTLRLPATTAGGTTVVGLRVGNPTLSTAEDTMQVTYLPHTEWLLTASGPAPILRRIL